MQYDEYIGKTEKILNQALSVIMAERILELCTWSRERTVPAG